MPPWHVPARAGGCEAEVAHEGEEHIIARRTAVGDACIRFARAIAFSCSVPPYGPHGHDRCAPVGRGRAARPHTIETPAQEAYVADVERRTRRGINDG